MKKHSRVYAAVDMDAIAENFRQMRENINRDTKMIAVIKTDGYGHGAVPVARMAEQYDYIWGYAVATVEEALELKNAGLLKPVLILGYTFEEDYARLIRHKIRPVVFKLSTAQKLSEEACRQKKVLPIHLGLDTGMSRIGFPDTAQSIDIIRKIADMPGLMIEGIFTHFARADEKDKSNARKQLVRYLEFTGKLEEMGIHIPVRHCSNSAGILEMREANLDAVRAGITIYGIYPSDEVSRESLPLMPAMELKSHIVYMKELGKGVPVSYGGTYVTDRRTVVATIPVGYGDGYPRSLSNRGWVLIRGKKAPILGRVCMDQFMVDVTDIPEAKELDEVTLMGRDGDEFLSVDTLAELSGRFPYEFVCDIGKRVPRVYYQDGRAVFDRI